MTIFVKLFQRPKIIGLAESNEVEARREQINTFLAAVLANEEHEFVGSSFISDEATIYDCSMDTPATWIANCKAAYNVDITDRLHTPLWQLVDWVKEQQ